MPESIVGMARLTGRALAWYSGHAGGQYSGEELQLYHSAAEIMTKRGAFAEFLAGEIGDEPGKVLEIAAGSGLVSSVLLSRFEDVTFSDLSLPALELFRARTGSSNSSSKVVNADFLKHPFSDDCFDTIVCVGGYRYVLPEQKKEFWTELVRITRGGGRLFFAQFKPRVCRINGTTLADDLESFGLMVEKKSRFDPRINFGRFTVATGSYEVVQYRKCSEQ